MATSKPMKQAALAGNARSTTGVMPLYKADGPSLRINSRNTSRMPLYLPAGAVCKRLFRTSAGKFEQFSLMTRLIEYTGFIEDTKNSTNRRYEKLA